MSMLGFLRSTVRCPSYLRPVVLAVALAGAASTLSLSSYAMSSSPSDGIETTVATQNIHATAKKASHIDIEKGQVDDREYHFLVLENQLRVLLISDPLADKAAASLDVHVGSSDDPIEREGLAHFLEHMLFLGTEKYPEAAAYQAFIDNNAGSHNAYTSAEHTNYFFDIDAEQLEPALDRFAQFFIAPLFDEAYVDRERNAVHSEYQAKIKDDSRRGYDVYRQQINPQHPYAKFSVGSLETLANRPNDKVRDDLIEFYQAHYSSDQMTLVVLGKESLTELQKIVADRFVQIPLKNVDNAVKQSDTMIPLFETGRLPFEVISKPVKDIRQMSMVFPLPSVKAYYGEKPLSYLGSLLGHEGRGSVLSLLKSKGWAEGLSAGGGDAGAGNATFNVSISLTREGVKHRETIRSVVFYALNMIRQNGIEEWRYAEEQRMAEIAFQFREKGRAISTVSSLSDSLHEYPAAEVISANYRYTRFDADLIEKLLSKMTPGNVFVSTVFPEVETDKITEKYHVPHTINALSAEHVTLPQSLTQHYILPNKNLFIPTNAQLFEKDESLSEPKKITLGSNADSVLWVKQDVSVSVPKVNAFVRVQSPLAASSPRSSALNQLLIDMINDQLNENSYPASLAGLSYSLSANSRGFDVGLQGYSNKMPVLLSMLSAQLQQPTLSNDRFEQLKIELIRQLNNSQQQTPYQQLFGLLPVTLFSPYYSDKSIVAELESITPQELNSFASRWLNGAQVKALVYGNVSSKTESLWQSTLQDWMHEGGDVLSPAKVAKFPVTNNKGERVTEVSLNVDHGDTAVGLYVQGTSDSLSDQANMVLLRQVLDSAFYSQLRTEQQLGYIVFLTSMTIKDVPGSFFIVQSPDASAGNIKQAVVEFLSQSEALIPDDLSGFKRSVSTKLLETPQALSAKASRYWQNVLKSNDDFDYRERLVQQLNEITPQELRAYYKKTLLNQDRLLWFVANKETVDGDVVLSNMQTYYQYE